VQLEFKDYNFDDLFGLVEKGDIDMVVSSITITEERQQKMLFSVPYFNGGQAIVTKVGNTDIKSVESISSKKVGVQIGTTGSEFVKKYVQDKSIVTYQDSASMVGAIKKGDIDLFVVDYIEATSLQKENPSFLKVVGDPLTQEFYGIATKLGNNSLIDATNDVLKNMNRSGEIDQLKQKWFK
jgi:polar amino acid transport system substrate-binding protein